MTRLRSVAYGMLVVASGLLYSSCLTPSGEPPSPEFIIVNDETVGAFTQPVWFGEHPAGGGRYLVAEKPGDVYLVTPGDSGTKRSLFASIPASDGGLDGLLTVAFHPDFRDNGRYYVAYTPVIGKLVVEERLADASRMADSGVSRELLSMETLLYAHNGGDLLFGPDGYLYIALGDGSTVNEFATDSQDLRTLHGKLLRIDVDHEENGKPYAVPPDNPFVNHPDTAVRPEIWAYGLRSPWRMSFGPDGRLFLVDVGHGRQDEVDIIEKGGNYGWRRLEGNECFNDSAPTSPLDSCDRTGTIPPIHAIEHPTPFAVCLIGGVVFRGNPTSRLHGAYIFGDYKQRLIHALVEEGGSWRLETLGSAPDHFSSFGEDSTGNLYIVGHHGGHIYRIAHPDL